MTYMNGLYLHEHGKGIFSLVLPNGILAANLSLPVDGRDDLNFDALLIISRLLGQRYGLIEGGIKDFRKYRQPNNIKIVQSGCKYNLYMNDGFFIAEVYMENGVVSSKVAAGISLILAQRWGRFIKKNTISSEMNDYALKNKASKNK